MFYNKNTTRNNISTLPELIALCDHNREAKAGTRMFYRQDLVGTEEHFLDHIQEFGKMKHFFKKPCTQAGHTLSISFY